MRQNPRTGAWEPVQAAAQLQAAQNAAYGMTGLPDMQQAYQAYQRGEYLPAVGQGAWGAAQAASMALPVAKAGAAATRAVAPLAREAAGVIPGLLADEAGTLRLFRYDDMARVPDVPQFDIKRYVPPRGVPENILPLAAPENVARVNEVAKAGIPLGGREWYNTEDLLRSFQEELGAEAGRGAYQKYINLVGATSPRSKVPENARNASYYYHLDATGQPLPEVWRPPDPATGKLGNWTPTQPLPQPYGHLAQGSHVMNARDVLLSGGFDVLKNPKPPSFVQNLLGNQQPLTADVHNVRLWGLGKDMPAKTEYGWLERLEQEQARNLGLTTGQYQASQWLGGAAETGVSPSSMGSFMSSLEGRVRATAKKLGEDPALTLKRFIRGEVPLI